MQHTGLIFSGLLHLALLLYAIVPDRGKPLEPLAAGAPVEVALITAEEFDALYASPSAPGEQKLAMLPQSQTKPPLKLEQPKASTNRPELIFNEQILEDFAIEKEELGPPPPPKLATAPPASLPPPNLRDETPQIDTTSDAPPEKPQKTPPEKTELAKEAKPTPPKGDVTLPKDLRAPPPKPVARLRARTEKRLAETLRQLQSAVPEEPEPEAAEEPEEPAGPTPEELAAIKQAENEARTRRLLEQSARIASEVEAARQERERLAALEAEKRRLAEGEKQRRAEEERIRRQQAEADRMASLAEGALGSIAKAQRERDERLRLEELRKAQEAERQAQIEQDKREQERIAREHRERERQLRAEQIRLEQENRERLRQQRLVQQQHNITKRLESALGDIQHLQEAPTSAPAQNTQNYDTALLAPRAGLPARAAPVTAAERASVTQQLAGCWRIDFSAANVADMVVTMQARVTRSGFIDPGSIELIAPLPLPDSHRIFEQNARYALQDRHCQPLRLPPEKYESWETLQITFDPHKMVMR